MHNGRASSTAQLIAAAMLVLARDARTAELVSPESVQIARAALRASTPGWRVMARVAPSAVGRGLCALSERMALPGIMLHYALRKQHLERIARSAMAEGFRDVVVLGAGFDALAYRMTVAGASCVELDHPATQRLKRAAIERVGSPGGGKLVLRPANFANGSHRSAQVSAEAPTLVIAEGLLMYLAPRIVESLLDDVRAVYPRCRVAFTFMRATASGRAEFRNASPLVSLWLRAHEEVFAWAIRTEELPGFLAARGLRVLEVADHGVLRRYLPEAIAASPLPEDELVCTAEAA